MQAPRDDQGPADRAATNGAHPADLYGFGPAGPPPGPPVEPRAEPAEPPAAPHPLDVPHTGAPAAASGPDRPAADETTADESADRPDAGGPAEPTPGNDGPSDPGLDAPVTPRPSPGRHRPAVQVVSDLGGVLDGAGSTRNGNGNGNGHGPAGHSRHHLPPDPYLPSDPVAPATADEEEHIPAPRPLPARRPVPWLPDQASAPAPPPRLPQPRLPQPWVPEPAGSDPPPPPAPEPVQTLGRLPMPGTVAGIHVEQVMAWQVVVLLLTVVLYPGNWPWPAAELIAPILLLLGLTATRVHGRWTYRYLLHRAWRHATGTDAGAGPTLTVLDARLGRRRRLASVFDGEGWSSAIRLTPPPGTGNAPPLGLLLRALERFVADPEHAMAEVQVVHVVMPAGQEQQAALPPVLAQTWVTCRVHSVQRSLPGRPLPDLLEIRRDLRRAIDGVLGGLVASDIGATALTTRQLHEDCVLAAGGRTAGPRPTVALPAPEEPAASRRARGTAAAIGCESITIRGAADLGDVAPAVFALETWPAEGVGSWLAALGTVRAGSVAVVITVTAGRDGGTDVSALVRHSTPGPAASNASAGLRLVTRAAGGTLRAVDADADRALLATVPLGSAEAHRELGTLPRFDLLVEGDGAARPSRPAGLVFAHGPDGPRPVPLLGPDPVWIAVLGGFEIVAAMAAAATAASLPVQVDTPEPDGWEDAFGPDVLELRELATDGIAVAPAATPAVQIVDGYGVAGPTRPALRAWQAGICRVEPAHPNVAGLLRGFDRAVVGRCSEQEARAVCEEWRLDPGTAAALRDVRDGTVTLVGPGVTERVDLDRPLLAGVGIVLAARPRGPQGPTINGHPMMAG